MKTLNLRILVQIPLVCGLCVAATGIAHADVALTANTELDDITVNHIYQNMYSVKVICKYRVSNTTISPANVTVSSKLVHEPDGYVLGSATPDSFTVNANTIVYNFLPAYTRSAPSGNYSVRDLTTGQTAPGYSTVILNNSTSPIFTLD